MTQANFQCMGFKINHLGSQKLSLIGLLVDLLLLVPWLGFDLLLLLNILLLLNLLLGIDCCLQGVRQLPGRGSRGQVLHNFLKSYSKTRGTKSECECWSGVG